MEGFEPKKATLKPDVVAKAFCYSNPTKHRKLKNNSPHIALLLKIHQRNAAQSFISIRNHSQLQGSLEYNVVSKE